MVLLSRLKFIFYVESVGYVVFFSKHVSSSYGKDEKQLIILD